MMNSDSGSHGEAAGAPANGDVFGELLGGFDVDELLRAPVRRVLFTSGNLSRVAGVETTTGERVVLKVRPDSPRLDAVARVQSLLHLDGQPVPQPLRGPYRADGWAASVELYVPGGTTRGSARGSVRAFARVLFDLIRAVPAADAHPELSIDPPPWVNWSHRGASVWPVRDTVGGDIRVPGPRDVDEAGAAAAAILRSLDRPPVIAHADFEDQNLRWKGTRIHVVHDWDSLAVMPEAAAVGSNAAIWPAGVVAWCATIDQATEFISAYEALRGRPFDADERRAAWAAALWHRAFNARKDAADGGGTQLNLFREDLPRLVDLAGVG